MSNFKQARILSKDLVVAYGSQKFTTLDKFPFLAAAILDISKNEIMSSLHEKIIPRLDSRQQARVIWGDTDRWALQTVALQHSFKIALFF